jgi:hypothetical protein
MIFKTETTVLCELRYIDDFLILLKSEGYEWSYTIGNFFKIVNKEWCQNNIRHKDGCIFYLLPDKKLEWDYPYENYYNYKFIKYTSRSKKLKRVLENELV